MTTTTTFWRRPWIAPLLFLTVAFLAFSLPPYLTLDPSQSRLPVREGAPLHYPTLVLHIFFGTIALLASCFQVWPWFRTRHPKIHRRTGRLYVFAGVLPASILAIPVSLYGHTGFVGTTGNLMLSLLWLTTTLAGLHTARTRRFQEHRRWMIRSFALGMSIVVNRLWTALLAFAVVPLLATTPAEAETLSTQAFAASVWLSWVVNAVIAEWWIEHTRPHKRQQPPVPVSQ